MPVSVPLKKGLLAGVAVAAFGGGLAWKMTRGPAVVPPAAAPTSLAKLSYDQLGDLRPRDRETLTAAESLFHQGRYPEALQRVQSFETRDGNPGHLRAVLLTGRCLLELDRLAEAEQAFRYLAAERPDDPDAHRGLAALYDALLAPSAEDVHLAKVGELDPTDYRSFVQRAINHNDMKHFETAESIAREGLRRDPPPAMATRLRQELAEALLGQRRYADALAAAPDDESAAARAVRAESLRMLTRRDEAEREVAAGLAADPDPKTRARLLIERGWLRAEAGDHAGAADAYGAAVRLDEFNLPARLQLSLALRRLGRTARADEEEQRFKNTEARVKRLSDLTEKAMDRPWDPAVRRDLADAYRQMNMTEKAELSLRAAAACDKAKP